MKIFQVHRNGVYYSTHGSYADACKLARIQANKDPQTYFTVHQSNRREPLYKADTLCGLNVYIVQPLIPRTAGIENTQLAIVERPKTK